MTDDRSVDQATDQIDRAQALLPAPIVGLLAG